MQLHDLILFGIAGFSEFLGTLSGFGSSTFFVPTALLVESFQFILALTAILHCFGNVFRLLFFRKSFEWKYFLILAIPSLVFTGLGAVLTNVFSADTAKTVLGVVLMLLAVSTVLRDKKKHLIPQWVGIVLSAVSGFSTGFVGTGGAIRGLALSSLNIPKNSFVALSSGIDVGGDFVRAAIYLKNGYMDWSHWFYIPLLGLAALIGARAGQALLNRINQVQFDKIVAVFVFLSGLLMIFKF